MGWNNIPLIPMANTPETFGRALSYEGQLHAICERFDVITSGYNDTIDYINENFPWTFADPIDWTDDREYPAFQVVYDEDTFSSYVSLQQVPVGTPLTDTEYWARTAGYNGQVQGIADQLSVIQSDVDDVASDVSSLQTAMNRSPYYGRKILCVTDSWGNENSHGVTVSWMRALCSWLGAEFIDLHRGSTGFIAGTDSGYSFEQRLTSWVAANPDTVSDVAYILVCGSINDHTNTHTDIASAIASFCNYARTNLPDATIIMCGLPMSPDPYKCSNGQAYNSWMRVCYAMDYFMTNNPGRYKCIYVPETYYSLQCDNPSLLMDDAIHPNQSGQSRIARCVYQVLNATFSKVLVRQAPELRITDDYVTYIEPDNYRQFSNITIRDGVLDGTTEFRFMFPDGYTQSSTTRFALNVPRVLPVSELDSATYNCLGTATAIDGLGNAIAGYLYTRIHPGNIPDNSSDDSYYWIGFVNNRSLGNLQGTVTLIIQWHINMTATNGVYS